MRQTRAEKAVGPQGFYAVAALLLRCPLVWLHQSNAEETETEIETADSSTPS